MATDEEEVNALAWRLLGDPAGQGNGWIGYGDLHKAMVKGIRAGVKLERDRTAWQTARPTRGGN